MSTNRTKCAQFKIYRRLPRDQALLHQYKAVDKKKGLICNLTTKFIRENILQKPCVYCGETNPSKMGIDRINNLIGHTIENAQPACTFCNQIRSNFFTVSQMKEIGNLIIKWKQEGSL